MIATVRRSAFVAVLIGLLLILVGAIDFGGSLAFCAAWILIGTYFYERFFGKD